MSNENYDFIESLLNDGKNEDEIFTALSSHAEIGILAAVRMYKQFLKDTGRVMSADERKDKIKEVLDGMVVDGGIELAEAASTLSEAIDTSQQTARAHVNRYCLANDIKVIKRDTVSESDVEENKTIVLDLINRGTNKTDIIEQLVTGGFDERKAKRLYTRIVKDAGLTKPRSTHDYAAIATHVKQNMSADTTKTVFAEDLAAKFNMPLSTAKKMYNYWRFAIEYQKLS